MTVTFSLSHSQHHERWTRTIRHMAVVLFALWFVTAAERGLRAAGHLPLVEPEQAGMTAAGLAEIRSLVDAALSEKKMPGCVVAVGRSGQLVYLRAFGARQIEPHRVAMTTDTIFDLASLTKPVATASSVMKLVEEGNVQLHGYVGTYLPEFTSHGKDRITVYHLLTHQAGLTPDNALSDYEDGRVRAWQRICELPLRAEPGARFIYSDVGYIVLGELVKRVSGKRLDVFARQQLFAPLGMAETGFLPSQALRARAAVTQRREGRWMQGEVHDPRAYLLNGVAGHAGLFSSAEDLAIYASMMLARGQVDEGRIFAARAVERMTSDYPVLLPPERLGIRGLGWDKRTGYSTNRGESFSSQAFGHGGFTGTALWMDPALDLFVIFLSNRVHPDGKGAVNRLAGRLGSAAAAAITAPNPAASEKGSTRESLSPVLCGIDVLRRDDFKLLSGKRVGLITNQTGIACDGTSTIQLLQEAPEVTLCRLFSPEHGIAGQLDEPAIDDSEDDATGLPIVSLYGERRRPSAESLTGIDVLVFDIQDIGTRFYTYISTMGYAMEAAAEHDVPFMVLDRPNPINGIDIGGPLLDEGSESFVGYHPIALRHAMTVGELALLLRHERELDLSLHVVPVEGWRRSDYFDQTGLPWINPSPNMRSPHPALLYPGIGLLETTNLSVGRGTDTPFERIGAPWLDGRRLARVLHQAKLPGISFVPIRFTPSASKYAKESCGGLLLLITDRQRCEPLRVGFEIARQLQRFYSDQWDAESYNRLLGNRATWEAVTAGRSLEAIEATYQLELNEFRVRRAAWLLYH